MPDTGPAAAHTRPGEGATPLWLPREIFEPDHDLFRDTVRRFVAAEMVPHYAAWEEAGMAPREIWAKAGAAGLLGTSIPEAYGGAEAGFLYDSIVIEELSRAGMSGPSFELHSYIVAPFLMKFGTEAQKQRWLPGMADGSLIASVAMTEPDSGSDLQAVRTSAIRKGDVYVVNGSKVFITNGIVGDLCLLVVKTDPSLGAKGVSLLLVDTMSKGYNKSRNLKKIGNKAQDTALLYFDDLEVPAENRLGGENEGWRLLMSGLVQERLIVAVRAVATCEAALEQTIAYTKERKAFGKRVFDFQNTRFTLADLVTEVQIARTFLDRCIRLHADGACDMRTAAMAKLSTTELQQKVLDACLQLHGGNGYMWEYWIARQWADARVHRIYAGTNEIMKELIGRTL
ncbi:MAG: acyl-CoA dehydrogenase family protein [Rhodospirillaceae bacterium]|nr:acyl-CoA dehydrogenase family protein [Rhodospirillaceae bacterium]